MEILHIRRPHTVGAYGRGHPCAELVAERRLLSFQHQVDVRGPVLARVRSCNFFDFLTENFQGNLGKSVKTGRNPAESKRGNLGQTAKIGGIAGGIFFAQMIAHGRPSLSRCLDSECPASCTGLDI